MTRVPLNLFGMPFGLSALAEAWFTASTYGLAPPEVGDALIALSAAVWVVVLVVYLRYALSARGLLARDLLDPVLSPFSSLAVITPMLLAVDGLFPLAPTAGRVVLDVFLVATLLVGAWFTGQWIYGTLDIERFHPGYFLPTAAGGLVAGYAASTVGQHTLGVAMFGLGVVCWLVLGSIILGRLMLGSFLAAPLQPTLAIEVAPPAVASIAWFSLHGDRIDTVAAVLGGYGLLMALAQLRLLPVFLRLKFMPGTWAFTFGWASFAAVVIHWLHDTGASGARAWEYVALAAITLFVGGIGVRTGIAVLRRELLPRPAAEPAGTPARV